MKLYGVNFSPFVQRVLIAGRIKGVEIPVEPPPGGAMQSPEFAMISPMRRIPVLEEADGWTLCESAPIVSYLEETLPGPSLLPESPRDRARARQIAGLVDTEFAAGLRHYVVQKLFRMRDEPAQLSYGRDQLNLGLDAIERIGLPAEGWAAGSSPGIADAALIPFLALADLIAEFTGEQPVDPGRAKIEAYAERAKADQLGARTFKEMRDGFVAAAARRKAEQADAAS
jgi:glutathione S-transferase